MSNQLAEAARQYLIATAHLGACPGTRDVLERAIDAHEDSLREKAAKPAEPEPLAWLFQHGDTGRPCFCANDGANTRENFAANNPRHVYVGPLYAAPVAVASPLSDEQIDDLWAGASIDHDDGINIFEFARAIEQAHGIKEPT